MVTCIMFERTKLVSMVDDISNSTVIRDTRRVEEGVNTNSEYESDELVDDEY